jgi:kumamolisin
MHVQTDAIHGHLLKEWMTEEGWRTAEPGRVIRGTVVMVPRNWERARAEVEQPRWPGASVRTVEELDRLYQPDPAAVVRVASYLEENGLRVSPPQAKGLYIDFSGTLDAVSRAFRCTFAARQVDGRDVYLNREEPQLPTWALPHVLAIVGLENRSQARPAHRYPSPDAQPANGGQGFFPQDLKTAYGFPPNLTGSGQTIGVLEFSNGYNPQDLEAFWASHGIPAPQVTFVSVDGTANDGGTNSVDMECTLDLEWAGAMAPGANLVVYEASAGTSDTAFAQSLLKALETATRDQVNKPTVLSISYGDAETHFPTAALKAWDLAAERAGARGITVLVASGDMGAYGVRGIAMPVPHCDAPACLPHMTAVGGTTLTLDSAGQRALETGWSDTNNNGASGGGVSQIFPLPSWQDNAGVPASPAGSGGRGVPDVALVADPDTGYNVFFQGASTVIGGTSAATPTWAGLIALINEERAGSQKGPLGFINPRLYPLGGSASFYDITVGNNSVDGVAGYSCQPGWDAVTGWGSANGGPLAKALA